MYRPGDRVELVDLAHPHPTLRPGATGTVRTDDTPADPTTVHVAFDSGDHLTLDLAGGDHLQPATDPAEHGVADAADIAHHPRWQEFLQALHDAGVSEGRQAAAVWARDTLRRRTFAAAGDIARAHPAGPTR